jgi:phosphate starvation-inducible protein PhoH and related proteins
MNLKVITKMNEVYEINTVKPQLVTGPNNEFLNLISNTLNVDLKVRGNKLFTTKNHDSRDNLISVLTEIEDYIEENNSIDSETIRTILRLSKPETVTNSFKLQSQSGLIQARSDNQSNLLQSILKHDITFSIGPAGTGKTFLSAAMASYYLKQNSVKRIVLVRPIVQAGEDLGFLPGDFKDKINPYLRPIFDALSELFHAEELKKFFEQEIIEIAPLAYMRGRTLNNAFIILDEAQNTTVSQMKMFLTRIGPASKVVINGDITQIDLPQKSSSGLLHAEKILKKIDGISFIYLDKSDIVRHRLIKEIVSAYEKS